MIIWIDNKSVLRNGKTVYKSGAEVPDGILSDSRIDTFLREKKIKVVDYIEVDKSDKKSKSKNSKKPEKSVQAEINSDDTSKGVESESSSG